MKKFVYEGETYYISNGKFYDSNFMELDVKTREKVASAYFSEVDITKLARDELVEFIKETKQSETIMNSLKGCEYGLEKFGNDGNFVNAILAILTSLYRLTSQPQKAVDVVKRCLSEHRAYASVPVLTSLAAAYCDLNDLDNAQKYAKLAYAKQNGGLGYTNELALVFKRIKKMKGE